MKQLAAALAAAILLQTQVRLAPEPSFFRFLRPVTIEAGPGARACAVLDRAVYADARPALPDLRLLARGVTGLHEVPYALTISNTAATNDRARVMNLGLRDGQIVFDLQMPARPYSEVQLGVRAENFLATARVTGTQTPGEAGGTALGTFTIFDLSGQGLNRSTTLPLAESTFPYLHIALEMKGTQGNPFLVDSGLVTDAVVPASRLAQTLYTTLWKTSEIVQQGRTSVANFEVSAHVPIERVSFDPAPTDKTNFSRTIHLQALGKVQALGKFQALGEGAARFDPEEYTSQIVRIRLKEGGKEIRETRLSVPAIIGSNAQSAAKIEVGIDNGDDAPLAIDAVRLEMRERKLCFDVPAEPLWLYYGDAKLDAPMYDYSRLFDPTETTRTAHLGVEVENPGFIPRVETRPLNERHPVILWAAFLAVISVLGLVAFRSAERV